MPDQLLTLVIRPEVEEKMIDLLLRSGFDGFTSFPCAGHGVDSSSLSLAEQVAGRERRVGFWIHADAEATEALLAELAVRLPDARIHYWLVPLVEHGTVEARAHGPNPEHEGGST